MRRTGPVFLTFGKAKRRRLHNPPNGTGKKGETCGHGATPSVPLRVGVEAKSGGHDVAREASRLKVNVWLNGGKGDGMATESHDARGYSYSATMRNAHKLFRYAKSKGWTDCPFSRRMRFAMVESREGRELSRFAEVEAAMREAVAIHDARRRNDND